MNAGFAWLRGGHAMPALTSMLGVWMDERLTARQTPWSVADGKGRAAETVPQNLRAMEKLKIAVVSLSGGTVVNRKSVPPRRAESVAVASGR